VPTAAIAGPRAATGTRHAGLALRGTAQRSLPLLAVLALFGISAFVVPTMAPVAVGDDWVYARSVEILLRQHQLKILDLSVVTLVFQVFWGALFAELFGPSLGALRLSTVAIMGLSGIACYGLCRELGISRGRSALGVAAYLFHPLAFVLAFTFMTDPHFTALLVIATYFYAHGLRPAERRSWSILAGSGVAAFAFLVRQQGALIPFAVVVYLLASRRLRPNRDGVGLALRVAAVPAAATLLYYLWILRVNGVPLQQRSFLDSMRQAGWPGTWQLIRWLTFIAAMYLGFFTLPIALAALVRLPRLTRAVPAVGWALVCAWAAIVVGGVALFDQPGRWPARTRMPYIPQYVGPSGLGPPDVRGSRPWLFTDRRLLDWLTAACAVASLLLVLALVGRMRTPATPDRAAAGLVLTIGLWQAVGVLPPSYHFRTWAVSMDRYLLPLLPFAVCLGLWALRDVWLPLPLAWVAVAALAVFSVAGTRDFLVFQQATWQLARDANAQGIPNTKLDAGAAWDGYHLWEYSNAHHIPPRTPASAAGGRPWWTNLFAPATDSSYVVATAPQQGYDVVKQVEYSSWLMRQPTYLYLLRRQDVPP
jgi:4-amino-4-deoxy-L-arabinose transferase-like glycosyltransferase